MSTAAKRWIVPFDAKEAVDMALVGGKCRNLALLTAAGLRVPPGFAVTTHAYREFMSATGVDHLIEAALVASDVRSPDAGRAVAKLIGHAVSSYPLPPRLTEEIAQAYQALGNNSAMPVAVRSSAIAEDLAEASFAGQHDTFLNIIGVEHVVQAVRDCWASLYSARAMAYRMQRNWQFGSVSMAVGVQALVQARAAGVLFTVNPHTGDSSQVVIEASWGLGEAVVAGLVTPDRYILDKRTGRTVEMHISEKLLQMVCGPHGIVKKPVLPHQRGLPCLTIADRQHLSLLAQRVEDMYGLPQDVEWAFDGSGECFLLQARPVTVIAQPHAKPQHFPSARLATIYQGVYRNLSFGGQTPLSPCTGQTDEDPTTEERRL